MQIRTMMRLIVMLLACLIVIQPLAAREIGWRNYANSEFGFSGAVPLNFTANGLDNEPVGQVFQRMERAQVLAYFGTRFTADFERQVEQHARELEAQGWSIGYRATTPGWAELQAVKGQRMLDLRLIVLCDRQSLAAMHLEYSAAHGIEMRAAAERLATAFTRTGC